MEVLPYLVFKVLNEPDGGLVKLVTVQTRSPGGEIRLVFDGTKIGFGHQLLIVCLAYRKRTIPIAWTHA